MSKSKFSNDPKVKLVSIESFYEKTGYLCNIKKCLWKDGERPNAGIYYKITPQLLITIKYDWDIRYLHLFSDKIEYIFVAFRDGKNEYEILDKRINELINADHKLRKKEIVELDNLKKAKKFLNNIKFSVKENINNKKVDDYIFYIDYKTKIDSLKNKYIVFDVETNGIRKVNDDLLSISLYDPTNGKCYNRFLPLELQPLVLTTWANGITNDDLENSCPLTQEELDKVIESFDLKNKILLSYSGGKGTFDSTFIINYCKRHNLNGFENLKFDNIKSFVPKAGYETKKKLSKDNLCKLMNIEGVQNVHSSLNDCILEWKLFERLKEEQLFFIDRHLYKFNDGYIAPITYLNNSPELKKFSKFEEPDFIMNVESIYIYKFPKDVLVSLKKFPTNITGISLENGINAYFNAEEENNIEFLLKNKNKLKYIGSLDSNYEEIPVMAEKDGTMKSLDRKYDDFVNENNTVTKKMIECLKPVLNFIETHIFPTKKIKSHEIVVSSDQKVLAICDLSDEHSVLEIKTFALCNMLDKHLQNQLYYESKGRDKYVLSIDFQKHLGRNYKDVIDSIEVIIYKVNLEVVKLETNIA